MDIAVVTKSICVYKDYEVRILEVQNVRVGGVVGGAVSEAMGEAVAVAVGGVVDWAVGWAVGGAVGSLRRVNRDVEG